MRVPTSSFQGYADGQPLLETAVRSPRLYRDGVPRPPARLNAADALLERGLAQSGIESRVADIPGCVTPAMLARDAAAYARILIQDHDLGPGMPVLFRAVNSPALMAAMLGALHAGAVLAPTVPLLSDAELTDVLARIGPGLVIADDPDEPALKRALADAPVKPEILALRGRPDSLESRAARHGDSALSGIQMQCDDPALVLFTSGTTGRAKAVMHSHGDILSVADSFGRHIFRATPGDVVTGTPSLAFAYGFGLLLVTPLAAGAAVAFPGGRGTDALRETLAGSGATMLVTAPTAYRKLLERPETLALPELRRCFSAGEPLAPATRAEWRARTGLEIVDLLGSTEMLGPYVSAPEEGQRPGAVGRAVPGYELKLIGPEGQALPAGAPGRLAVRGPTGGVYLDTTSQEGSPVDGWTVTGDVCVVDTDGYVRCLGRADDIIVSSGYNISAIEVENALAAHPDVADCAATGLPDPLYGQALALAVVPREGVPDDDTLRASLLACLQARLAVFKLPRHITCVDALPRTASGKVRRAELPALFSQDVE